MDPKPSADAPAAAAEEHVAYPRMSPEDIAPPPPPVVPPAGANPYVLSAPSSNPPSKACCGLIALVLGDVSPLAGARENLRDMFGMVGKKFNEAARKTEGIAGDVWQHLKTGPSIADTAMGRIAQISKVISEGGYDKIFQQTFECSPDEKLKKAYVCYLSTSHGPIMGVLYLSTVKIAFGSDSPVKYVTEDNKTQSSFYKVVLPLPHLRSVIPTASQQNPAERYIQVVSVDNHEFWFMGFVNYDSAVKNLQEAVRGVHGA
ncbi:GEM-like protein 1 isoform X1 [Sorghum bicolor]|uniref:GEM-like protein 1 isoform X1 n=1 Tax=Sorghum bicolor TaxID=4558 RepID=UPI00081ACAE7|nr:GEM-like protein 1 isoform X1 [Sorghum bicolor]|eukprot:XP_021309318.1 GEM-like protein 1 isoform X1 [Sorghum bicolor]